MGDLISRDAAFDEIIWNSDNGVIDARVAIYALRKLPSVEPERKSGKWILKRTFPTKLYNEYLKEYRCSECYREIRCIEGQLVNYPYCHCGAKMEGADG